MHIYILNYIKFNTFKLGQYEKKRSKSGIKFRSSYCARFYHSEYFKTRRKIRFSIIKLKIKYKNLPFSAKNINIYIFDEYFKNLSKTSL